jgi:hypothetical protein
MSIRWGGVVAAGALCAVFSTVGVWSGPLLAASGSLHTKEQSAVHATSHPDTAGVSHTAHDGT